MSTLYIYIYIYVRPCANVRRLQGTAKVLLNLPGLGELCVRPTRKALESRWWQLQNFCQGFGLLMGRQTGRQSAVCSQSVQVQPRWHAFCPWPHLDMSWAKELLKAILRALLMFQRGALLPFIFLLQCRETEDGFGDPVKLPNFPDRLCSTTCALGSILVLCAKPPIV